MNASIIANKGFVAQFATEVNAQGQQYLASSIISTWSAMSNVCQIIGQVTISFICARFGRKIGMYTLWFILMISVLIETVARNWHHWVAAKMFAGLGVGCLQAVVLGYITEVAPIRIRGSCLMLYSFWWTIGSFCTNIALTVMNAKEPYNWLTPIYTQWGQIGLMLAIYVFLPESPAWCVSVGREESAKKWLTFLNRGVKDFDLEHQYQLLVLNLEHERAVAAEQRSESWWSIFKGTDGRRTLTAAWTITGQQFLGLALFSTYGTYFFQQAGLADPFQVKCITVSLQIVTVVAAVFGVDKFGRRMMACCATTTMWVACVVVGIIGVAPTSSGTIPVFILFACIWSKLNPVKIR
jgi:MFS family permease